MLQSESVQADLFIFDSNVCYGPRKVYAPGADYDLANILMLMKKRGVARAMVTSTLQSEYHPSYANVRLQAELAGRESMLPVWVILPHHTGEFPHPMQLRRQLAENRVYAVKIFPAFQYHNFPIDDFCCGDLLDMLEEARIPLFIDLDQLNWSQLDGLCHAHPSLRLLLQNVSFSVDRALFPLLDKHENLFVESSSYRQFRGLEWFVRTFGSSRMIFGSGMPYSSLEAALSMINYADIDIQDQERIAGFNLEKMLREVIW